MKCRAILVLVAFLLVGCSAIREAVQPGEPGIINVSHDDEEVNAAIAQAQGTLATFVAALQSPKPNQQRFSVKARFAHGSPQSYEHMWIDDVSYDGKSFTGILGNDPVHVKGLKYGDPVTVPASELTDWMIVEDGKLIGGYTLRVFFKRMSAEEREAFVEETGLMIDD